MSDTDTPRIERWYRDPTMTDGHRMALVIGDLDRLERTVRDESRATTQKLEAQDGKLDRIFWLLVTVLVAVLGSSLGYIISTAGSGG